MALFCPVSSSSSSRPEKEAEVQRGEEVGLKGRDLLRIVSPLHLSTHSPDTLSHDISRENFESAHDESNLKNIQDSVDGDDNEYPLLEDPSRI